MGGYFSIRLLFFLSGFGACTKNESAPLLPVPQAVFDSVPASRTLTPLVSEISGIADSKTAPQHLWGIEDSGNPPQLYQVKYDGTVTKKVYLKGAVNVDWEEMGRAGNDLYIGDIGDNNLRYTEHAIYKFEEPATSTDTVFTFDKIRFNYPDGPHNAEAFFVLPDTKDIYIITKQNAPAGVYKIAFPYLTTGVTTATLVTTLDYSSVVSAALSVDGNELIVKTYTNLYYYKRKGQTIEQMLQTKGEVLPYKIEPQGEAVTFALNNSGFFTLSEKGLASTVNLYFYKRK